MYFNSLQAGITLYRPCCLCAAFFFFFILTKLLIHLFYSKTCLMNYYLMPHTVSAFHFWSTLSILS